MTKSVQTNKKCIPSINLMRLICAFMVIAIHIVPFNDSNYKVKFILIEVVPRIAVPFFFVVSGFFFSKNLEQNNKAIRYIKKILFTYIIWSSIYFIYDYIIKVIPLGISLITMIKSYIVDYIFFGPSNHLWYFHALIFCLIITLICYRYGNLTKLYILSFLLYCVGLLGCSYYGIGINIPILNKLYFYSDFISIRRIFLMGFPYFMLGYFIKVKSNFVKKITNCKVISLLIVFLTFFIIEIIIVVKSNMSKNIIITLFLYPLVGIIFVLCLKNPMYSLEKYSYKLRAIANFTYYSHPLIYWFLRDFQYRYGLIITNTKQYILICILTTLITLIINKLNCKICKKLIS